MQLSSISLAITSLTGRLFSPRSIFTTGVNGVWHDPSDLTTLFQDSAGTTPVTAVEQPVGLMLDKSKGLVLGSELVTNGDFDSATSWVIDADAERLSISGGQAIFNEASAYKAFRQQGRVVSGRTYQLIIDVAYVTSGSIYVPGILNSVITTPGVKRYILTSSTPDIILMSANLGATAAVNSISVRELPGNHAFQATSANRPTLSARYNLLTKSEDFSDAVWIKSNAIVTTNATTAPDGTLTADRFDRVNTTPAYASYNVSKSAQSIGYAFSIAAKRDTGRYIAIRLQGNYPNRTDAVFDLLTGTVGTVSSFGSGFAGTVSIVDQGNGWYRCTLSSSTSDTGTLITPVFSFNTNGSNQPDTAGSASPSSGYIWGADLRVTNDALNQPAYQRVNTATDYDTVGFKPYLSLNGVNQWLQTNSIDFTYGDKMFVSAGARKLSDAAAGTIAEIGTSTFSTNGSFGLRAPATAAANYGFLTRGTAYTDAISASVYSAPITSVISGIGNISAPSATLRVNGTQVIQSTATQGTGNYGNYPLYIGARAGTSLFFNGRLYGLVVAGKQASASEIASTEAWLNQKTGAY